MIDRAASGAVLDGQEFYRVLRRVRGPGDLIELDASTKAIAIGPDSELSEVAVVQQDIREPAGIRISHASVRAPFIGLVTARPASPYQVSGNGGRIYCYPSERVGIGGATFDPLPVLDLLCYFDAPKVLPAIRKDFILHDRVYNANSYTFPFYGRRSMQINTENKSTGVAVLSIVGLQIGIPSIGPATIYNAGKVLHSVGALAPGGFDSYTHDAFTDGAYDLITYSLAPVVTRFAGATNSWTPPGAPAVNNAVAFWVRISDD